MAKWVYMFTEGNATMRNLLGGKGANLAEMTSLGLPVPQGFTVALRGLSEPLHEVFELYCVECHLRHYNGLCWAVRYIFTVM